MGEKVTEIAALSLGDVFAVPLGDGMWGAARVVGLQNGDEGCTFFVLDGFWDTTPTEAQVLDCPPMKSSMPIPGLPEEWKGWFDGNWPEDFEVVARSPLSDYERAQGASSSGTMVFQDAGDFVESLNRRRGKTSAPSTNAPSSETTTLTDLVSEDPFEHWKEMWDDSVVLQARRIFREAIQELIALGDSASVAQREAVLRGIVDGFNELDEEHECMETGEREEVVERIEKIASLVGVSNDDERLTGHRDW